MYFFSNKSTSGWFLIVIFIAASSGRMITDMDKIMLLGKVPSESLSLRDWVLANLHNLLGRLGFFGIFLFASVSAAIPVQSLLKDQRAQKMISHFFITF